MFVTSDGTDCAGSAQPASSWNVNVKRACVCERVCVHVCLWHCQKQSVCLTVSETTL